mmetsp:Transcript_22476/g.38228  ORF Transcript_22476/g.38228 Transcript_22476/m.38228 type:complete len:235 (-) Transcript_22476:1518-2222(-)
MTFPKLWITYFGIGGRAEAVRLAAAVGKVPFTNVVVPFNEFVEKKDTFPLGQLPMLEIEEPGKEKIALTQSMAMLRYVGKLAGLYPEDPVEAMKVDAVMDTILDMEVPVDLSRRGAVRSFVAEEEWTADEKMAIRKRILEKSLPKYLGFLEKQLEENGTGFLVGDRLTIADLKLFYLCALTIQKGILDGIPSDLFDAYPKVKENLEKVKSIPEIAAWYEQHPGSKYPETFDFAP